MNVSVIGLGKLGASMAATFAAKGLRVRGVDRSPRIVDLVNRGVPPVREAQLAEMMARAEGRLTADDDIEMAVRESDVSFIVVATPSEPSGGFSLCDVEPVCAAIGRGLARRNAYHVVCLTSTVMPGSTGTAVRDILERESGKRCGTDFGLCYSPEFIALGTVIRDFLNPDMLLIGESDRHAGDVLEAIYRRVCENEPVTARMSFIEAEITKLAVNAFITTKISFANLLARISERSTGANVDVITAALGLDRRIGARYLTGAVSYGGPCFPRDTIAMSALARDLGIPTDLPQAVDRFNTSQIAWLADQVVRRTSGRVGILGLTYKPGTDVLDHSVGLLLSRELAQRGYSVSAYDPGVADPEPGVLPVGVSLTATARECVIGSDLVVLATPWPEFASLDAIAVADWARTTSPRVVIDCWRVLNHLRATPGVEYVGIGLGAVVT
jgi:UDPglucose 6-dehydrogenase